MEIIQIFNDNSKTFYFSNQIIYFITMSSYYFNQPGINECPIHRSLVNITVPYTTNYNHEINLFSRMLQLDILAQGYAREISETHSQGKSYSL